MDDGELNLEEELRTIDRLPPSPLLNFGSPTRARPTASTMLTAAAAPPAQHQGSSIMGAAAAGQQVSLDEEFAAVLGQLLLDRCDAKDATAAMEMMAQRRSQALKQDLSQQVHRPARYMHLQALAAELDAQAATWHLVWCLHCNEMPPAGTGGPEVMDAAGIRTTRQMLADHISSDPQLTRCAAVIAWLESMADDVLNGAPGSVGQPRFAEHEGVWLETKHRLGHGGVLTELDPDAPARQGRLLHPDNAKAEERITFRLWQLIRSGRIKDARALCRACGQPWRAASIGGPGGDFGPLPVGLAAGQLEEELSEEMQVEDIMHEVAAGPSMSRSMWKWTCLQMAQRAAKSGARYEAALYGALCGHLPTTLAVCGSWEDACWAYCRAWLDVATDAALSKEPGPGKELDTKTLAVNGDVLVRIVRAAASSQGGFAAAAAAPGAAPADAASNTVMSALTVLDGQWPGGVLPQASGGLLPPSTFDSLFAMLAASGAASIVVAGRDNVHQIQQHLIKDNMAALAQHLYSWLVAKDGAVASLPPGTPTSTALHPTSALSYNSGDGDDTAPEGHASAGAAGLPSRPARLSAFGCHLLLGLEGLGVLKAAGNSREAMVESTRISALSEQVVAMYLASLLERQITSLAPQYLCHLGETMRGILAHETLSQLTAALIACSPQQGPPIRGLALGGKQTLILDPSSDAACYDVYHGMEFWFGHCFARQQQLQQQQEQQRLEEAGKEVSGEQQSTVMNKLKTNIRPQETRTLLDTFMDHMRLGAAHSPLARVTAARWLFYPHLRLQRDFGGSSAALAGAEPCVWTDALELANALCCELALAGSGAATAAADYLLSAVVSQGFEAAASDVVDGLRLQCQGPRAEVNAAQAACESAEMSGDTQGYSDACAAAAVAESALSDLETVAQQILELLAELSSWRLYFELERRMEDWREQHEMLQAEEVPSERSAAVAQQAEQLLVDMTEQLLKGEWMANDGMPSLAPQEQEQLGSTPTASVELVVTAQQPEHAAKASDALRAAGQPFKSVKGAELYELETQLRTCLAAATHPGTVYTHPPDKVTAQVSAPAEAEGFVTVSLSCALGSKKAWQSMVSLAVSIVQGSLPGLCPQVYVVNLCASRPASIAICRRCCLGQAIMHCSSLRAALAALGGDGSAGAELAELLAGPVLQQKHFVVGSQRVSEAGLVSVLSPAMLQAVLRTESETVVQVLWNQQQQRQQRQ